MKMIFVFTKRDIERMLAKGKAVNTGFKWMYKNGELDRVVVRIEEKKKDHNTSDLAMIAKMPSPGLGGAGFKV